MVFIFVILILAVIFGPRIFASKHRKDPANVAGNVASTVSLALLSALALVFALIVIYGLVSGDPAFNPR